MNKMKKHNHNSPPRMNFLHTPPLNTTYAYQAALKQSATGVWMNNFRIKLTGVGDLKMAAPTPSVNYLSTFSLKCDKIDRYATSICRKAINKL